MRLLFRTENGEIEYIRQWFDGDDTARLPVGCYFIASKTETIIIRGNSDSEDNKIYDFKWKDKNETNNEADSYTAEKTERDVTDIGHYEIDDKIGAVAVVRYIDGLRYSVTGKDKERFPQSNEPIMYKGIPFTGRIDEKGKYIVIKKVAKGAKPDKVKIKDDEISELAKLAESMAEGIDISAVEAIEEKPFDEEGAFDDMLDVSGDSVDNSLDTNSTEEYSVSIGSDKMTVTVICAGVKYVKTFKSEPVAERQFEMIKGTIAEDKSMVKDLVEGPTSTFVKQ